MAQRWVWRRVGRKGHLWVETALQVAIARQWRGSCGGSSLPQDREVLIPLLIHQLHSSHSRGNIAAYILLSSLSLPPRLPISIHFKYFIYPPIYFFIFYERNSRSSGSIRIIRGCCLSFSLFPNSPPMIFPLHLWLI